MRLEGLAVPAWLEQIIMNSSQRAVMDSFRELSLGMAVSGVNTNMFLSGMSSIDVLKLHHSLQNRLGIEFSITEIFNHPLIKDLAAKVSSSSFKYSPSMNGKELTANFSSTYSSITFRHTIRLLCFNRTAASYRCFSSTLESEKF